MTFVSYAQNFEDVLLWRALNEVTEGRYVDIGAQDPVLDSVSLAFYEAGWRGIHVEPTPAYAAKLRAARPNETVIEAAVTDAAGPMEFFEIEDTGISTGRPDIAEYHANSGFKPRKILVPTVRLDALLREFEGDLHWMKVDVEGMEPNVLRSWGDSQVRPWLLVVEATFPNSPRATHNQWIEEVLKRDYCEVFYDGLSRYFVHQSQRQRQAAFAAPPNVFDSFAIAQHHFAASGMRAKLEDAETRHRQELAQELELREAARASAGAALQSEQKVRNELAAASAKEAALVTRMLEEQREHVATLDALWRDRQAAEGRQAAEFKASTEELHQALELSRRSEFEAYVELATLEERAKRLQLERDQQDKEHKELRREVESERRRERKRMEVLRGAETAARIELARLDERANSLERNLAREIEQHEQFRVYANDEHQRQHEQLEVTRASEVALRAEQTRLSEAIERLDQALLRTSDEDRNARGELERDLQWHRAALSCADALIRDVREHRPGRWQRLGQRLGFSHTPEPIQALSKWSPAIAGGPETNPSTIGNRSDEIASDTAAQMNWKNPYLRADSLAELLAWDDVDFVRCAYVTVLGRQPDSEGEAYYTTRIRQGHSKMEVLWQLRRSPEGPTHDPAIAGFDRALKKAAWARGRLVGWIARAIKGAEGDGISWRTHRALLNALERNGRRMEEIGHRFDSVQLESKLPSEDCQALPEIAGWEEPEPPVEHLNPAAQALTASERLIYTSLQS